jgi:hypothetical protein
MEIWSFEPIVAIGIGIGFLYSLQLPIAIAIQIPIPIPMPNGIGDCSISEAAGQNDETYGCRLGRMKNGLPVR